MTAVPYDRAKLVPWLIFDRSGRWLTAAHRFAAELTPDPWVAAVRSIESPAPLASNERRAIVLWRIDRPQFRQACDWVAGEAIRRPADLRLVAAERLTAFERVILSELGASQLVDHPEDLQRLAGMIRRYLRRR